MKKLTFVLCLMIISLSTEIFGQMGKSIFPYISFFDGYVNYRIPPYNWGQAFDPQDLQISTKELSTLMDSLGITHSVSWADCNASSGN
ncbi:MAG: hypothetical protein B6D45_04520, partial [Ignavibacteriales bacterium UTCHB3]